VPGRRILLAAEFDRGPATVHRLLPLAAALADRGHDITLALPIKHTAEAAGFPAEHSPAWDVAPPPGFLAVTYADLLLLGGYGTPDSLKGLIAGWHAIFARTAPDLLVADFAPTAMLAARAAGLPTQAIGDGYSLPPLTSPLPVMRPWADIPPGAAADSEGRILAVINALLPAAPVRALRSLFAAVPTYLCAFPELDHYPERGQDTPYYGAVFPPSRGPAPAWPDARGQRAYVDLDPRHPALPAIIDALDTMGLPSLIQSAASIARPAVRATTTGNRNALLGGADLVICQSQDIAVPALLAGKPLLMLPVFTEQMMTLHRVAAQGLGHGTAPDADPAEIQAAIRRLADDRACRQAAAGFARSYDGYRPGLAIEAVADAIDEQAA